MSDSLCTQRQTTAGEDTSSSLHSLIREKLLIHLTECSPLMSYHTEHWVQSSWPLRVLIHYSFPAHSVSVLQQTFGCQCERLQLMLVNVGLHGLWGAAMTSLWTGNMETWEWHETTPFVHRSGDSQVMWHAGNVKQALLFNQFSLSLVSSLFHLWPQPASLIGVVGCGHKCCSVESNHTQQWCQRVLESTWTSLQHGEKFSHWRSAKTRFSEGVQFLFKHQHQTGVQWVDLSSQSAPWTETEQQQSTELGSLWRRSSAEKTAALTTFMN